MTNPGQNYTGGPLFTDSLPCPPTARELLDLSSDVFFTLDNEGRFIQINAAVTAAWGYERAELAGLPFIQLLEDRLAAQQVLDGLADGEMAKDRPARLRCKDGSLKPVLWSAKGAAAEGVIYGVAKDDVREPHKDDVSRPYSQRLSWAYKLANVGWWEWHPATNGHTASDEFYDIVGLRRSEVPEITTELFQAHVHPDDRTGVEAFFQSLANPTAGEFGHRFIKPDGSVIHLLHFIQSFQDEEGRVALVQGFTKDITQIKEYESALRVSQQKLEDIVESLGDGFFVLNHQWVCTYWNRKAEDITGKKRTEMVGRYFWDVYPRAKDRKFYTEYQRAVREKVPVHFEEYSRTHQSWMEISAYPSPEGLSVYMRDITSRRKEEQERRLLNEKLHQATKRLQEVLESMSDGFYTVDRNWNITFATDKIADMLGLNKDNYIGKNLWECFPELTATKLYSEYHKAFATNSFVSFETYVSQFNMWLEINAYPTQQELSVYVRDITERKRQEQELRVSNERFEFVSKATSDIIWDWNVEAKQIYINQSFTNVFGYELEGGMLPSQLWKDSLHPGDKERVIGSQVAALQNPAAALWEDGYRFFKKCGEIAYVTDRAVIIRNEEGRALRMIGAVKDITERKKQERRLEFIARATSEVIWECNLAREDIETDSEKLRQMFGYEAPGDRLPLSFWYAQVHPDDVATVVGNLDYALKQGLDFFLNEYRVRKTDGSWSYVKNRIYVLRNAEGKAEALVGALEDVTRERLAEKALVESENSYRQLFNNAPLAKIIYDTETLRILDVNSAAVEHYGFSREEFLEMTTLDIRPKEEHPNFYKALADLKMNPRKNVGTFVHRKKSGERMTVEVSLTTINYKGRKANLSTVYDITEKTRLQEQLLEQKVNQQRSITRAAIEAQERERSEIGKELHDNVNQMLTTAKLYVENIGYYPAQSAQFIDKSVGLLQSSINEIRRLSSALAAPAIRDVGFRDTVLALAYSYKELDLFEVVCSFHFEEERVSKEVKLTIYRILQEAFNNTVKYAEASLVVVHIKRIGRLICVGYEDNGKGFDPLTVRLGAGLNNIKNRAEADGGTVQVNAAPGAGCRLKITLPIS